MIANWWLGILAVGLVAAGAGDQLQIATMAREGRLLVSCALTDGLPEEMEQALQSGLTTTFAYDIDLRRVVTVWFDRTVASATVTVTARLDTLTGRYQVTRSVDGRIEESRVSDSKADVLRLVTGFERVPVFSTADLAPNEEYIVRVRLRTRPRMTWFLWPFTRGDGAGTARFTFIP